VVRVTLVGDFMPSPNPNDTQYHKDAFRSSNFYYKGNEIYGEFVLGKSLSLLVINSDSPLSDNTDPDRDYGVRVEAPLFTTLKDVVNFQAPTAVQKHAIAAREWMYESGSGNDVVTLPDRAGYKLISKVTWNRFETFHAGEGRDAITGGNGGDRIDGGSGNDVIKAGAGNDRVIGGFGIDVMAGGSGRDTFTFDDGHTGLTRKTADTVRDFSGTQGDRLSLSAFDANIEVEGDQAFTFRGTREFNDVGQARYVKTAANTYVYLNTDSDMAAEAVIRLSGAMNLSKDWFVL
jgi:Ca2+-binding RTX toxin-like protein